jgi:hypothetical protein
MQEDGLILVQNIMHAEVYSPLSLITGILIDVFSTVIANIYVPPRWLSDIIQTAALYTSPKISYSSWLDDI